MSSVSWSSVCVMYVRMTYSVTGCEDTGLANTCANRLLTNPCKPKRSVTTWKVNYLVSNQNALAAHIDADLVDPWGIVVYNNQLWVVGNGSDSIFNYDLFGNRLLAPVSVRDADHNSAHPSGIAVNCGGGFPVSNGTSSRSGVLIVATEHGTIHSYNPTIDTGNSYIVVNQQLTGDITAYDGLALANNTLYLANFFRRTIDVFDSNYMRLYGYHFVDDDSSDPIPLDYAPANIVHLGNYLYIMWARQDPNVILQNLDGPGNGYISVFNLDGSFVRRFASRGVLNTPWAMIPAPCECGIPPNSFLVGNNGDGRVNIFDYNGRYIGPLLNQSGLPVMLEGLWGLAPHYTDFNEIFFTSSANENIDAIVGSLIKDQVIYF